MHCRQPPPTHPILSRGCATAVHRERAAPRPGPLSHDCATTAPAPRAQRQPPPPAASLGPGPAGAAGGGVQGRDTIAAQAPGPHGGPGSSPPAHEQGTGSPPGARPEPGAATNLFPVVQLVARQDARSTLQVDCSAAVALQRGRCEGVRSVVRAATAAARADGPNCAEERWRCMTVCTTSSVDGPPPLLRSVLCAPSPNKHAGRLHRRLREKPRLCERTAPGRRAETGPPSSPGLQPRKAHPLPPPAALGPTCGSSARAGSRGGSTQRP